MTEIKKKSDRPVTPKPEVPNVEPLIEEVTETDLDDAAGGWCPTNNLTAIRQL